MAIIKFINNKVGLKRTLNYICKEEKTNNNNIIVSDDAFLFLEKYGIKVISIDPDTAKEKTIAEAKKLLENNTCNHVFIKYKGSNDKIDEFLNTTNASTLELYTMTNLKDIIVDKNDYITLMNQNLENLKLELYK